MGKFYTVIGNSLYTYLTKEKEMISLPPILGLFKASSTWSLKDRIVIYRDVPFDSLRQARVILEIHGYKRRDIEEQALERYFTEGDERLLGIEEEEEAKPGIETEKKPVEELWRTEATLMTMLPKLETAYREGKLEEEVYMEERNILEEKLEACKREAEERFAEILSEAAGEALAQEMLERSPLGKEGEEAPSIPAPVGARGTGLKEGGLEPVEELQRLVDDKKLLEKTLSGLRRSYESGFLPDRSFSELVEKYTGRLKELVPKLEIKKRNAEKAIEKIEGEMAKLKVEIEDLRKKIDERIRVVEQYKNLMKETVGEERTTEKE